MENKQIKFNTILLQEDLVIQADAELIEQVLINLVLNAMDAVEGKESPVIELVAGKLPSNQIMLQVKDNGIGMDQEVQQHIFVPFYTTKKKGSGIGLSLTKQIMLLHKGNITVHSVLGEGSSFKLYF
jgi:signal transduction histidine kinase